jgi:4a-hydroxytetrahydrobiopterin dehydratase
MALLTDIELTDFLARHPEWASDGFTLRKTFELSDFIEAMSFVTGVALLSEKAFHHPDVDIRWNKVTIALSTHDEGGLTRKDTDLATKIEGAGGR